MGNIQNISKGLILLGFFVSASVNAAVLRDDYDLDGDGLIELYTLAELDQLRAENKSTPVTLYGESTGCDPCIGYELMADLDFDTDGSGTVDAADDYWNSGFGWAPLEDFEAIFEGNGYTISNFYIDVVGASHGLFLTLDGGAVVRNLNLADVNVTGVADTFATTMVVGAIAGSLSSGTIENCSVTGDVSAEEFAEYLNVGGLVGSASGPAADANIIDSSFTGRINTGQGGLFQAYVGGLVGQGTGVQVSGSRTDVTITAEPFGAGDAGGLLGVLGPDSSIDKSYAKVNASVVSRRGNIAVGGLAGQAFGQETQAATIANSGAEGSLQAIGTSTRFPAVHAAGLVGKTGAFTSINKSSSSADSVAQGDSAYAYAGGLVGFADSSKLTNSYATGTASATEQSSASGYYYAGSVMGYSLNSTVLNTYGLGDVTAFYGGGVLGSFVGSDAIESYDLEATSNGTNKLTATELQCPTEPGDLACSLTIYTGWSATDWDFGTVSQYPVLIIDGVSTRDTDGDGVPDPLDAFPDNAAASVDADEDGKPDAWNESCDATCQGASGLELDDVVSVVVPDVAPEEAVTAETLLGSDGGSGGSGAGWLLLTMMLARLRRHGR